MSKMGRPLKEIEISLEEIIILMVAHAKGGGFLCNLPAYIHKNTSKVVSNSYLDHIQDEHFLQTKSLAKAYCSEYWTEQAHLHGIPSAMWIFIQKNVAGWRDMKDVKIDAVQSVMTTDSAEELRKENERLRAEIAEQV